MSSDLQSVSMAPAVGRIADLWTALPPHIREAILTLVDAGLLDTVNDGLEQSPHRESVKGGTVPKGMNASKPLPFTKLQDDIFRRDKSRPRFSSAQTE